VFRRWLTEDYCPGPCRCRIELVKRPEFLPLHHPTALHIRVHNTSLTTWALHAGTSAGIHACFALMNEQGKQIASGKAGLFDALVPPGGSLPLTLTLPPLKHPGRYHVLVDMVEEQHCTFYQVGSEPLEEEFVAREE
jgi:hypothetical protein